MSYTARVAALAIGSDLKWVDNVLSHYEVTGVEQGRRGVERRLNDASLLALALCRVLSKSLGAPLASAVAIANEAVGRRSDGETSHFVSAGVSMKFSLDEIERRLRDRLSDAAEAVAHVRRGRPTLRPRVHD